MKPILILKQQHQNNDLVILSKKEYERLFYQATKRKDPELESDIVKSLGEARQGKVSQPFEKVEELMHSLRA